MFAVIRPQPFTLLGNDPLRLRSSLIFLQVKPPSACQDLLSVQGKTYVIAVVQSVG